MLLAQPWYLFLFQNKLTMLDIASNRIKKIENVSHLTELQEFWVSVTTPMQNGVCPMGPQDCPQLLLSGTSPMGTQL